MKTISIFVGIAKTSTNKGMFSLSVYHDGEVLSLPAKIVRSSLKVSNEELILNALNDVLGEVTHNSLEPLVIDFYADNNEIKDTWDKYNKTGKIAATGAEKALWNSIKTSVVDHNINLTIKGEESPLSKINKIENQKARTELKKDKQH